jgi:hypothetical protein
MDFSGIFRDAWRIFVKDIGVLIMATLIAVAISVVTIGILSGKMFGGLYLMILRRLRDGQAPEIGDVFECKRGWLELFIATLVMAIIIAVGLILFIVPGLYIAAIWLYVIPLMIEKDLDFGEARKQSRALVETAGVWDRVVIVIILWLLQAVVSGGIGLALDPFHAFRFGGLLWLVTVPYGASLLIALYLRDDGRGQLVDQATR